MDVSSILLKAIRSVDSFVPKNSPLNESFVNNHTSALFMQPDAYAGDFQQPEQRVGQIAFRFSF